jgi:hypothetical protein
MIPWKYLKEVLSRLQRDPVVPLCKEGKVDTLT